MLYEGFIIFYFLSGMMMDYYSIYQGLIKLFKDNNGFLIITQFNLNINVY